MAWEMLKRLAIVGVGLGTTIAACATGSGADLDDDGLSGGGADGPGSTGTQMNNGGMGGTSNVTTDGVGGMLPPCDEDPCKIMPPQCGCPSGEMCTVNGSTGQRVCAPEGTAAVGETCGGSTGINCAPGALCVTLGGGASPISTCRRFCTDDNQCDGFGGICQLQLSDAQMNPIPDMMCSENCDLVSNSGCSVPGTKCWILLDDEAVPNRFFTACGNAGNGTLGTSCTEEHECAPGFGCVSFTDNNQNPPVMREECARWIDTNTSSCGTGEVTLNFTPAAVVGAFSYAACVPL